MATTYTVDSTGGGTHLTIAAALAVVVAGDTVLLTDGQTFAEGDLVAAGLATGITIQRTPGVGTALNDAGDGPPLIDAAGFTWAVQFEQDWHVEGVLVQGCTGYAWKGGAGFPTGASFRWVNAASCGGLVGDGGADCTLDLAVAVLCTGQPYVVYFVGLTGNTVRCVLVLLSEGTILASSRNGVVERCVWVDGDAAASGYVIFAGLAGGIARNCIVHDPGTGCDGIYVGSGGLYDACCVDLDDVTRTPYQGHTPGETPSTCLETDPLFLNALGDYHLDPASPCLGAGSVESLNGPGSGDDKGLDGLLFPGGRWNADRLDIGCYATVNTPDVSIVRAIVRGSHLVDLIASAAVWLPPAESAHRWAFGGEVGLVSRATIDTADPRIIHIRTAVPLNEATVYRFYFDAQLNPASTRAPSLGTFLAAAGADFFRGGDRPSNHVVPSWAPEALVDPGYFWAAGGRASLPDAADERAVLVDFDAPTFDANGLGGGWRIGDDGAHRLVGGLATIERIVWAHLLTHRGELRHDPTLGTRLRVKHPLTSIRDEERYLAAQLKRVPYVKSARVTLSQPIADAIDVAVEVQTEIGIIRTRRTVARS